MPPFRGQLSGKPLLPKLFTYWYRNQCTMVIASLISRLREPPSSNWAMVAANREHFTVSR